MKKNEYLICTSLLAMILLLSCDKEKPVIHSECKKFNLKSVVQSYDYGSDSSCVSYNYNFQEKKLTLKHINAAFNCCPGEIYCDINIKNDTIYLSESEEKAECDCNCLYDIDINISEVASQQYCISIYEPYCNDQEKILFEIDLTLSETGVVCAQRTLYPWGL